MVGIQGAVDFYELFAEQAPPEWVQRRNTYEEALGLFEQGQFGAACRTRPVRTWSSSSASSTSPCDSSAPELDAKQCSRASREPFRGRTNLAR